MVEYHGWFVIRDSPGEGDQYRTGRSAATIRKRIDLLQADHRILGMKVVNANYMVWFGGCTNHWASDIEDVFELIRHIGDEAPGSFGLVYVWNDESQQHGNAFRVWRLAKGQLTEHDDPFLSPCIPTIEDAVAND